MTLIVRTFLVLIDVAVLVFIVQLGREAVTHVRNRH